MIAKQHSRRYCELTCRKLHVEQGWWGGRSSFKAKHYGDIQSPNLDFAYPTAGRHPRHFFAGQTDFHATPKVFLLQFPAVRIYDITRLSYVTPSHISVVYKSWYPHRRCDRNFARWSITYWGTLYVTGFLSHPGY